MFFLRRIVLYLAALPYKAQDTFDVGQDSKRYIFMPKMGVVKVKGIFYRDGK